VAEAAKIKRWREESRGWRLWQGLRALAEWLAGGMAYRLAVHYDWSTDGLDYEEIDRAVALKVFGVPEAVLDAWPWGLPEFSQDRGRAAGVAAQMMRRKPETVRLAFERRLRTQFELWGGDLDPIFLASALVVIRPVDICMAALRAVDECASATRP